MSSKKARWQPIPSFPGALTYFSGKNIPDNVPVQASAPYSYDTVSTVGPAVVRTPVCYNQAYAASGGNNVFISDVGGDFIFQHYSFSYRVQGAGATSLVYARLDIKRGGTVIWAVDLLLGCDTAQTQAYANLEGNPGLVLQKGDSFDVYVGQGSSVTYVAIASVTLQPYK